VRSTSLLSLAVIGLLGSVAQAATAVSAPQSVTTQELQRYIYQANYPTWCGAASQAAREMRVKPTTDPKTLHGVMKANITECANTPYAQQRPALWNTAVFGAAAAALLAARHESAAAAIQDATHAKNWSADIVKFTHSPGPGNGGPSSNTPSMYRTNAGRIHNDANALLEALQKAGSGASNDGLPSHVSGPGATSAPHPSSTMHR
jgi:hypothetical protein